MSETKSGYLQPFDIGTGREAYYPPTRVLGVEDCASGTGICRLLVRSEGQSGPYAMNVHGKASEIAEYVNGLMMDCAAGLVVQATSGAKLETFEDVIVKRITDKITGKIGGATQAKLQKMVPEMVDSHLRAMAAGEPASAEEAERSDDIAPRRNKAKEKAVA